MSQGSCSKCGQPFAEHKVGKIENAGGRLKVRPVCVLNLMGRPLPDMRPYLSLALAEQHQRDIDKSAPKPAAESERDGTTVSATVAAQELAAKEAEINRLAKMLAEAQDAHGETREELHKAQTKIAVLSKDRSGDGPKLADLVRRILNEFKTGEHADIMARAIELERANAVLADQLAAAQSGGPATASFPVAQACCGKDCPQAVTITFYAPSPNGTGDIKAYGACDDPKHRHVTLVLMREETLPKPATTAMPAAS